MKHLTKRYASVAFTLMCVCSSIVSVSAVSASGAASTGSAPVRAPLPQTPFPEEPNVVEEGPNAEDRILNDPEAIADPALLAEIPAVSEVVVPEEASVAGFTTSAAISLKATNYPIPSGAVFVAPWGNDNNAGTQAAPWRTVRKALAAAPNGATVVLRGGTYREGGLQLGGKRVTLQPYPYEQVWLKGSVVVTGWAQEGGMWRKDGWTPQFKRGLPSLFIDPAYPMAAYPDMVFVNGTPLRQVGSKSQVKPGTFYADYNTKQLYIGDNPGGKTVEAAAQSQALRIVNAAGSVVRGLGFAHYATHRDQYGAVQGNTSRLTFENNTFTHNAAQGLSVLGVDAVIRANNFTYNGQLGLHANRADRMLVEGNRIAYNNQERFLWEAGGAKLTTTRDMVVRDNLVEGNLAKGLWMDVSCYNTTIVRNVARNNALAGIMYEISAKAVIASNVAVNNGAFGIYVSEAEDIDVYNNTLVRNRTNLRVFEGRHTNGNPQITYNVRDVIIRNNILSNGMSTSNQGLLSVDDVQNQKTAEQMGVSVNYNAYYRTNAGTPATFAQWSEGASDVTNFKSFDGFRSGTTQERNGLAIDNVGTNPFFVNEAAGDYRLKQGSGLFGRGTPLPSNIAAAIGVPAGVPVNLGALKW